MSVIVISTSLLIIFNFITVKGVTITIIQKQVNLWQANFYFYCILCVRL